MVFLIDFYRQPDKMKSHQPEWALEHIRADRLTFMKEIEESGFVSGVRCVVIRIKSQSFICSLFVVFGLISYSLCIHLLPSSNLIYNQELIEEPELGLAENYCMVFLKKDDAYM